MEGFIVSTKGGARGDVKNKEESDLFTTTALVKLTTQVRVIVSIFLRARSNIIVEAVVVVEVV